MFKFFLFFFFFIFAHADYIIGGRERIKATDIQKERIKLHDFESSDSEILELIIERSIFALQLLRIFPKDFINEIEKQALEAFKKSKKDYPLSFIRDEILISAYFERIANLTKVEPQEIEKRKKEHLIRNKDGLFLLREIFLKVPENASIEEEYAVFAKIEKFRESIQVAGPAKFFEIARKFSQRTTKYQSGFVGFVNTLTLEPMIAQVVSTTEPGTLIGPFRESGGFCLLLIQGVIPPGAIPDDKQVEEELKAEKMNSKLLSERQMLSSISVEQE